MSNKAKSVFFKLLSFACCVVPPVTAPVMVFLVLWILCGALSGVIAQFAQAMKIGCISSAAAVGFDIASYVFKKRGEAEEKEQK